MHTYTHTHTFTHAHACAHSVLHARLYDVYGLSLTHSLSFLSVSPSPLHLSLLSFSNYRSLAPSLSAQTLFCVELSRSLSRSLGDCLPPPAQVATCTTCVLSSVPAQMRCSRSVSFITLPCERALMMTLLEVLLPVDGPWCPNDVPSQLPHVTCSFASSWLRVMASRQTPVMFGQPHL